MSGTWLSVLLAVLAGLAVAWGVLVVAPAGAANVVPVLGYADDAIAVAVVLRSVVRRAGPEAVARHWTGTDDGLAVLLRLTGLDRR